MGIDVYLCACVSVSELPGNPEPGPILGSRRRLRGTPGDSAHTLGDSAKVFGDTRDFLGSPQGAPLECPSRIPYPDCTILRNSILADARASFLEIQQTPQ